MGSTEFLGYVAIVSFAFFAAYVNYKYTILRKIQKGKVRTEE